MLRDSARLSANFNMYKKYPDVHLFSMQRFLFRAPFDRGSNDAAQVPVDDFPRQHQEFIKASASSKVFVSEISGLFGLKRLNDQK